MRRLFYFLMSPAMLCKRRRGFSRASLFAAATPRLCRIVGAIFAARRQYWLFVRGPAAFRRRTSMSF